MRQMSGWFCFVLLLGVVLGFTMGKSNVTAQSVDNQTSRWLAGTGAYGQGQDAFFLFDSQTNRIAAYAVGANKRFELLAVREISWDLKPMEFGKQKPTIKEMKKSYEESRKNDKKEEK